MVSRFLTMTVVLTVVMLLTDAYFFKGLRLLTVDMTSGWKRGAAWLTFLPTVISLIGMVYLTINANSLLESNNTKVLYGVFGIIMVFWLPKVVFNSFHLVDDLLQATRWTGNKVSKGTPITRWDFITKTGLAMGGLMLGATAFGVTRGRFHFRTLREKISSPKIPLAFVGKKIIHISDAHLGSFPVDSGSDIQKAVDMINAENADYIFFTGDLVNNFATEAEPWIGHFSAMKAKSGKFSVLGNHDYGDYAMRGDSPEKAANLVRLKEVQKEMGFKLMLDENLRLEQDGEFISLVGMENWGKGFQQYGDFKKAIKGVTPEDFKILLSHDPTQWEEQVIGQSDVDLTLSGHTHGMQMGVEIPWLGIKFSPARIRYKRWGGLYAEGDQKLYINRGLGYLGLPARIGMWPEITVLELDRA